ncbi:MAG: HAD family phosphatase [Patescibacteria group bacterium]
MKAAIFDMDGVIVDSEPLHMQHLHEFLRGMGVDRPQEFETSLKGVSANDTWKMLIEAFNLEYEINDLVTRSRQSYVSYLESLPALPVIPGAADFIKYTSKKGYRLALASSAAPKRIELFLQKLKLRQYFETIVSGDDIEHSKPAPDIFLLAAKKLGMQPRDCVVVEDAWNGVQAARAAGMKCIAYGGSVHNTDDLSAADIVVKDFKAFVKALKTGLLPA